MRIVRNGHGIPWITAGSLLEVAHEQGRAFAEDRAWQLDLERRRGEGRVAELLGPTAVDWDTFARQAELAETAQRAFAALSEETQGFVTAYAEGVNAAFEVGVTAPELDELGTAPGTWQPWTPLAVFWVQHVLFGSFADQLWQRHVRRTAGEDALHLLRREGPLGGSNAVVLGGGRTSTGLPLIAGDPHRLIESPGIYAQVRLTCTAPDDAFDVVGLCFVGVPGIQHFGQAEEVAWAITNAAADTHDLHAESDSAVVAERTEHVPVAGAEPVPVRVRRTARGPIVAEGAGERLSIQAPPDVLGDLGAEAFPMLLRARSVGDVAAAFDRWIDPVNNVVAADRTGRAVHLVAGRVPDREHGGWLEDLPRRAVDPDEVAVAANHRVDPSYDALGRDFAPPFRADRIAALLAERQHHTAGTVGAVLADVRQNAADALLDLLADLPALPVEAALLRRRLLDWHRRMTATSTEAALYVAVREEVVRRVCAAPALAGLRGPAPYGRLFGPWFDLAGRVSLALPTVLAAEQPFGIEREALVHDALVAVAEDPPETTWGTRHRFHALHGHAQFELLAPPGPATPLSGDTDCVLATGAVPGSTVTVRGPVARYVWDLADRDASRWVVPLGASGVHSDPHHVDQHETWAAGDTLPVRWPAEEEQR